MDTDVYLKPPHLWRYDTIHGRARDVRAGDIVILDLGILGTCHMMHRDPEADGCGVVLLRIPADHGHVTRVPIDGSRRVTIHRHRPMIDVFLPRDPATGRTASQQRRDQQRREREQERRELRGHP